VDSTVLSCCSLLRNPNQNRPVCWSIIVKEEPNDGSFSGRFLLTASLRRRRVPMYSELQIPVDYTIEFREYFEAIP